MAICEFILDNKTIHAGGKLTGKVKYHLDAKETFHDAKLIVGGKAYTSYRLGRKIIHVKNKFLREEIGIFEGQELSEGIHTYPFTFVLPLTCPSSFTNHDSWSSVRSSIKYTIKIKRSSSLWTNTDAKEEFFVVKYLDLNCVPEAKDFAEIHVSKDTFWFCCTDRPVFVHLQLSRKGFTAGESIPFTIECNNRSSYSVNDVLVSLRLIVHYYGLSEEDPQGRKSLDLRSTRIILSEISLGSVKSREKQTWSRALDTPKIQPLHADGSNLYDITYILYVKVKFPFPHKKATGHVRIILGNVPIGDQNSSHQAPNDNLQIINNLQDLKRYKIVQFCR